MRFFFSTRAPDTRQQRGAHRVIYLQVLYHFEPLNTQKSLKSSGSKFKFEKGSTEFEFEEILPLQLQPPTQFSHSQLETPTKKLYPQICTNRHKSICVDLWTMRPFFANIPP